MRYLLSLLICTSTLCKAQTTALSKHELRWVLFHPFAALKVKKTSRCITGIYNSPFICQQLDSFASGGRLDAFRHVFYMAAFTQKVKVNKLRKLGRAHERANYRQFLRAGTEEGEVPDSLGSVMDLANNELGFRIGSQYRKLSYSELKDMVIKNIHNGEALIMKRNSQGQYLNCQNQVIAPEELRRWQTPKCLVSSNTSHND